VEDPKEARRKRLAALKASGALAVPAAPPPVAPSVDSLFRGGEEADDEDRTKEAEQEQRRRRLQETAAENEREKRGFGGGAIGGGRGAARAEPEDEEDPLDVFMRTQVADKAQEEKELAERHLTAWQAQYGDKDVEVSKSNV